MINEIPGINRKITVTPLKLATYVLQAYSFNRDYDNNGVHFDYLNFIKWLKVMNAKVESRGRMHGLKGYFMSIELNGVLIFATIGWLEGNQYGIDLFDKSGKTIGKRI